MSKSTTVIGTFFCGALKFTVHSCGQCGNLFALHAGLEAARREDHKGWYCTGCGATWVFVTETVEERLRGQLKRAKDARDHARTEAEHQERRARSYKGKATRARKRAEAGLCHHCNRTFKNLRDHMQTQHVGTTEERAEHRRRKKGERA